MPQINKNVLNIEKIVGLLDKTYINGETEQQGLKPEQDRRKQKIVHDLNRQARQESLDETLISELEESELEEAGGIFTRSRKHSFLLAAKNLYLNYPDCNLEFRTIREQLKKNYHHTS